MPLRCEAFLHVYERNPCSGVSGECMFASCAQPAPELGLLHAAIAKVAALLDQMEVAAEAAENAARILRITTGNNSEIVSDMMRLRHDIGASQAHVWSED